METAKTFDVKKAFVELLYIFGLVALDFALAIFAVWWLYKFIGAWVITSTLPPFWWFALAVWSVLYLWPKPGRFDKLAKRLKEITEQISEMEDEETN